MEIIINFIYSMGMEFHDLEVFITVAKEKSFSKAARIMLRTQPAISLAIRRLEDEINEKLFDRSSKEPQITYEGEILYQYAQKLLNTKAEVFRAINEVQELHRGHLRIAGHEISILPMLNHLSSFHKQYPKILIEIIRCTSQDIISKLSNHEVDFGLISYNTPDRQFQSQLLFEDRICCVAYPDHELAQQDMVYSIKRLKNEKFAAHQYKSSYRNHVERMFERHQVPLNIDIELPTIESIKIYIEDGNAIAILPLITVKRELEKGTLKEIKFEESKELQLERRIQLIYRKSADLSHSARALLSSIDENLKKT